MFLLKSHFIAGALFLYYGSLAFAASCIEPPLGSLSVRAGAPPASGMFDTITGIYNERINITRPGPLTILGYTTDTSTFASNEVLLQGGIPASVAGSDDASGTLRVHKDNFSMYNVNVSNTFGPGTQAIAISQYGSKVGLYACAFIGYQDTLYANRGTQVFLKSYIEGAVDFIFGRQGLAYFGGNTIAVKGEGCITASGRQLDDSGSYVFDHNTIVLAADAFQNATRNIFLGRPWGDFAKVIFKNTVITAPLNQTIWSIWNPGDERTDNVLMAEYNTTGSGVTRPVRPAFSTLLTEREADAFNISSAIGGDYESWVDLKYLV